MQTARVGGGECSVELIVCDQCMPRVTGRSVIVPRGLLDLDARTSLLGESVAGLLLSRVEGDDLIRAIAERYRVRVLAEEVYGLYQSLNGLVSEMRVSPVYPAYRRAWLLGEPYLGLVSASPGGLLEEEYDRLGERYGIIIGGRARLAAASMFRDRARLQARRLFSVMSLRAGRVARRIAMMLIPDIKGIQCGPARYEPSRLVGLPEGLYFEGDAVRALEEAYGEPECRRPSLLSSSLLCSAGGEKLVVKRYAAREAKWLPATIASPSGARMSLSAARRLSREYVMLRRLREVAPTPRILGIVREPWGPAMIRSYIEGVPVLESRNEDHWRAAGRLLARVHTRGYALLDSNPGNMVYTPEDDTAIIDAEQAGPFSSEAGAWDLLVFTVYSIIFSVEKNLVLAALRAYREEDQSLYDKLSALATEDRVSGRLKLMAYPLYQSAVRLIREAKGL